MQFGKELQGFFGKAKIDARAQPFELFRLEICRPNNFGLYRVVGSPHCLEK